MKQCEFCGTTEGRIRGKLGKFQMDLCDKHYAHMLNHGKLSRTIYDPNEIVTNGDVSEIILYNKDGDEISRALFNTIHIDIVKERKWYLSANGYVVSMGKRNEGMTYLHRLITKATNEMVVDHINHDKLNNLDTNIRTCTCQENMFNQQISKANTSGCTGVLYNKSTNKYRAVIKVNRKNIHLGSFLDINDAIEARHKAVEKYFGEFAYNPESDVSLCLLVPDLVNKEVADF